MELLFNTTETKTIESFFEMKMLTFFILTFYHKRRNFGMVITKNHTSKYDFYKFY